ncbi:MAG TPA: DUF6174 domain-containing protein [Gemmatimonadaceae bacterium]|nr:DUF6174 domain-containing protein [Gemmatimonadaceae bacterium]
MVASMNAGVRWTSLVARCIAVTLLTLVATGCSASTGPDRLDVSVQRAEWNAQGITNYEYDYLVTGFFIAFAGKPIRLTVRNGEVQSAVFIADSEPTLEPASSFPTIDQLFDRAEDAGAEGLLTDIAFDPQLHFPTEMDIAGPPDASGSVFASNLRPIQ